jgi:hypothetical protein
MSGKDVRAGWMEGLQAVQPRGGASAWKTNMAVTPQRRAQCVVWYAKFSSVTRTQRAFRRQYNYHHVPPHRDIVKWYNMFLENGLTTPYTGGRVRDRNRKTFRVHGSRCAVCQLRNTFHTLRARVLPDGTSTCFHTTYLWLLKRITLYTVPYHLRNSMLNEYSVTATKPYFVVLPCCYASFH